MCRIDLGILPQIRCKCKCFLKKVDFFGFTSHFEKDSLRPEEDAAQATEGGWRQCEAQTERAYNAFRMMSYSTGFIFSMSSGLPSRMLE